MDGDASAGQRRAIDAVLEGAASAALEAVCGVISREVQGGGAVTLPGIGKIYCRERPERMVRNPATGEQIKKEADKVVKMTIAKALKDSVNA